MVDSKFLGKKYLPPGGRHCRALTVDFPTRLLFLPIECKAGLLCLAIFVVSYIESHDSWCNLKPTVICVIIWRKKVTKTLVLTKTNTQRTRKTKWSLTFLQMRRTRKLRRAWNGVPALLLMQSSILTTVPLGLLQKCCQTRIFPYNFYGRCLWSDCHANKLVCNIAMQEALQSKNTLD